jgi:hypothetical protein
MKHIYHGMSSCIIKRFSKRIGLMEREHCSGVQPGKAWRFFRGYLYVEIVAAV